jgi:hypothetical protein
VTSGSHARRRRTLRSRTRPRPPSPLLPPGELAPPLLGAIASRRAGRGEEQGCLHGQPPSGAELSLTRRPANASRHELPGRRFRSLKLASRSNFAQARQYSLQHTVHIIFSPFFNPRLQGALQFEFLRDASKQHLVLSFCPTRQQQLSSTAPNPSTRYLLPSFRSKSGRSGSCDGERSRGRDGERREDGRARPRPAGSWGHWGVANRNREVADGKPIVNWPSE